MRFDRCTEGRRRIRASRRFSGSFLFTAAFALPALPQNPPSQEPWKTKCCWEKGSVERDGNVTVFFHMEHADLVQFKTLLEKFLRKGSIEISPALHAFVVTDVKENIDFVKRALIQLHSEELPREPREEPEWRSICCYRKNVVELPDGRVSMIYYLHHENLEQFKALLTPFLNPPPKGDIQFNNEMHLFLLTDERSRLETAHEVLTRIHLEDFQVMLEAKVVELRWDRRMEIGLEGGEAGSVIFLKAPDYRSWLQNVALNFNPSSFTPTGFQGSSFRFRTGGQAGTLSGILRSFVERGRAQVLSNPRVMVTNHGKATLSAGDRTPFLKASAAGGAVTAGVEYQPTGIDLDVTAHVLSRNMLRLKLTPKVSNITGFTSFTLPVGSGTATTSAPIIAERTTSTEVIVQDGEEIVIGGLLRRDQVEIRRGIPLLADIPILGYLFSNVQTTDVTQEIVFIIKPKIVLHPQNLRLVDPRQK